jgi:hypothetical protein
MKSNVISVTLNALFQTMTTPRPRLIALDLTTPACPAASKSLAMLSRPAGRSQCLRHGDWLKWDSAGVEYPRCSKGEGVGWDEKSGKSHGLCQDKLASLDPVLILRGKQDRPLRH